MIAHMYESLYSLMDADYNMAELIIFVNLNLLTSLKITQNLSITFKSITDFKVLR